MFKSLDLGTRALVRADFLARSIEVIVNGPARRDFLSVLRSEFKHIHSKFEKFYVSERIPLPELNEITVSYDHLIRLEEAGETEVFPEGATTTYPIADLLGSVRVSKIWSEKEFLTILKLAIAESDNESTAHEIANEIITLQPNFFGLGVNLNSLIKKVFRAKKNSKKNV